MAGPAIKPKPQTPLSIPKARSSCSLGNTSDMHVLAMPINPLPNPMARRKQMAVAKLVEKPRSRPNRHTLNMVMRRHGRRPHRSDAMPHASPAAVRPIMKAPVIQPAQYPASSTVAAMSKSTTMNATKGNGAVKTTECASIPQQRAAMLVQSNGTCAATSDAADLPSSAASLIQ